MKIIRSYQSRDRKIFTDMMCDYFKFDLNEEISNDRMQLVVLRIEYEMQMYPMFLRVLTLDEVPAGFLLFQIDTAENPWGLRIGQGFVREMYLKKELRGQGLGEKMVEDMFDFYLSRGVKNAYLTAESEKAVKFWSSRGFSLSGEIHEKNDLPIMEATIGNK